jgi:sec-independent protein translocase protein TatA
VVENGSKGRCRMGEFSPIHWMIVALVILVLFGGRKIPEMMRGLGQGIREFKEGMKGEHPGEPNANPPANPPVSTPASTTTEEKK